jgi:Fibronectin type III domain
VKFPVLTWLVLVGWLVRLDAVASGNITLSWSPSPDADATGYKICYGTASGNYTRSVSVGLVTNVFITNLCAGVTYYFAAKTLYAASGEESAFSGEATFTPAGVLKLTRNATTGGAAQINFPVEPGHWYEVQATTNLVTWTTIRRTGIATSNSWVQASDPAGGFKARYYRLVLH